jgi:hypothetical protein
MSNCVQFGTFLVLVDISRAGLNPIGPHMLFKYTQQHTAGFTENTKM